MVIISDTSVITYLIQLEKLYLLKNLFDEIIISPKVEEELLRISNQESILKQSTWIVVRKLKDERLFNQLLQELDPGEAESIALAVELEADLLLIDEKRGRKIAEQYNIRITGLLGILIQSKEEEIIMELKPTLDKLIYELNFRISPNLYQTILKKVNE